MKGVLEEVKNVDDFYLHKNRRRSFTESKNENNEKEEMFNI